MHARGKAHGRVESEIITDGDAMFAKDEDLSAKDIELLVRPRVSHPVLDQPVPAFVIALLHAVVSELGPHRRFLEHNLDVVTAVNTTDFHLNRRGVILHGGHEIMMKERTDRHTCMNTNVMTPESRVVVVETEEVVEAWVAPPSVIDFRGGNDALARKRPPM